jgi:hypothetical protein
LGGGRTIGGQWQLRNREIRVDSWVARLTMRWDAMRWNARRSQLGLEVKFRLVERSKARILAMARDYFVLVVVAMTIRQPRKCQHRQFFGGV